MVADERDRVGPAAGAGNIVIGQWDRGLQPHVVPKLDRPVPKRDVMAAGSPSIIHLLRRLAQLFARRLRVTGRRIQILVPENLSEPHKVIVRVGKKLVGHRVAEQVRMQVDARCR